MNDENSTAANLDELRQRWEAEPTPQLTLQLAEEYRHQGQIEEAVVVLESGLEAHSDHVAARVALGRYRAELGRLDEGREVLEAVVAEDPTHLVANKALVALYADLGDEKQARDRLDLYKVLNEGDPAIEELEARLRGETTPPDPEISPEPAQQSEEREPRPAAVTSIRGDDPFAGLGRDIGAVAYWQAVGAEGIFPTQTAFAAAAVAVEYRPFVESEPPHQLPEQTPDAPEGPTVTLANLYLEQGHLDDAERSFQEILARDPNNSEAIDGLQVVLERRGEAVSSSPQAQKVTMLKSYLERIRASAEGH